MCRGSHWKDVLALCSDLGNPICKFVVLNDTVGVLGPLSINIQRWLFPTVGYCGVYAVGYIVGNRGNDAYPPVRKSISEFQTAPFRSVSFIRLWHARLKP